MANLTLTNDFSSGVYRIEQDDYATGGEDGLANLQAKQLGARTNFLNSELETLKTKSEFLKEVAGAPAAVIDINISAGGLGLDSQHNGTVICIRDLPGGFFLGPDTHENFPVSQKEGAALGTKTGHITMIAFAETILVKEPNVTVYYSGEIPEGFTNTFETGFFIQLNAGDRADIFLSGSSWYWHVTTNK